MFSFSSSYIGSSNMSSYSPRGSSLSQPSKKRDGWLCEAVGVLGKNFPELFLFLRGMKGNIFGWFLFLFPHTDSTCKTEID